MVVEIAMGIECSKKNESLLLVKNGAKNPHLGCYLATRIKWSD
jgi:hypothetical protein